MEVIDPVLLNDRDLAFRAASLHADRTTKEILRLLKADILRKWGNTAEPEKREALWHELQAIQRFADKLESLAGDAELAKRKDEAAKRRAARVDKSSSQW